MESLLENIIKEIRRVKDMLILEGPNEDNNGYCKCNPLCKDNQPCKYEFKGSCKLYNHFNRNVGRQ